jgi:hypothetical protein
MVGEFELAIDLSASASTPFKPAGHYRIIAETTWAATNAVLTRIMAVRGDGSQLTLDVARDAVLCVDRSGNIPVKRPAITVASIRFHGLWGMPAMVRAKLLVASAFGKSAKRPASRQGSRP